uniref:Dentin sialophosphoprotein n=1 Tax=Trifolium pratense TaxID=57577 RepID=A0A2K3LJR8_TRIPR
MLGKGVSREYFQPRTCSTGKNASKTGQAKRDLENIVYIDLDSDQFDDVEIIDCPEAVLEKLRGFSGPSKDRTSTPQSVISIDDDDDDESDDVDHSGIDVDGVGEFDSDASSNKRFSTPSSVRNSVHADVDDCDVYVSKRHKSTGFYSNHWNRDGDCSDCEVIKREQWEKVSAKRNRNENNIINQKEKHKETKLYKQAMEEELASRQRALQIQAEEAQKLRKLLKRKKAENGRMLDIERRSKKRLEEVKEKQKKDEELMNTKDKLRVEILKIRLSQLERRSTDMTSLLRGLGINVGESLRPSPNEVHAAYKKAILKFHPDRASKTDINKQVEAEETFKLLSVLKKKFCSTSWR